MQWRNQPSRVNLAESKTHIVRKVGVEKSKLYFHYLNEFLNLKLSKTEFNKQCVRVLGKENIPLHNQLICSILKNACNTRTFSNGKADFDSQQSTITGNNNPSENDLQKLGSEVSIVKDKKEISTLVAPIGLQFRKPSPLPTSHRCAGSCDTRSLLSSHSLRDRIVKIAASNGLDGVSMESADLLNRGLDVFLKRLIKSCVELVGSSSGCDIISKDSSKLNSRGKPVNGFLQGHHMPLPVPGGGRLLDGTQGQRSRLPISLLDFKVAMQLTPEQLGEDWPLLLEKIMDSLEE